MANVIFDSQIKGFECFAAEPVARTRSSCCASAMAFRKIINVGSHVEGVNEAIRGWVGTVKAIEGEALAKRFFIEWHSNDLDRTNPPQDGQQYSKYPMRALMPKMSNIPCRRLKPNPNKPRPPIYFPTGFAKPLPRKRHKLAAAASASDPQTAQKSKKQRP